MLACLSLCVAGTSPSDPSFVFKLVSGRFVFNPHASAYMNVIHGAQGALRGHGNDPRKVRQIQKKPEAEGPRLGVRK